MPEGRLPRSGEPRGRGAGWVRALGTVSPRDREGSGPASGPPSCPRTGTTGMRRDLGVQRGGVSDVPGRVGRKGRRGTRSAPAGSSPPHRRSRCHHARQAGRPGWGRQCRGGPGRDEPGAPNEQTATGPAGPPPTGPRAARGAWGPGAGKGSGEAGPWTWGPDSPLGGQTNNRQKWAQACPEGGQFPDHLEPGAGAAGRGRRPRGTGSELTSGFHACPRRQRRAHLACARGGHLGSTGQVRVSSEDPTHGTYPRDGQHLP